MSDKEVKICAELEMDVERELEEEIKEGICHLAFRLQRLYQQQKERNAQELFNLGNKAHQQGNFASGKILSEVNINIKMEGGTKIEIKEIKKRLPRINQVICSTPKSDRSVRGFVPVAANSCKKFDWARSLRSAGPQGSMRGSKAKLSTSQQLPKTVNMSVKTKMLEKDGKE